VALARLVWCVFDCGGTPNKGRIEIGDWDITDIKPGVVPYLRRQIGVIFQDFKLLPKKKQFRKCCIRLGSSW